MHIAMNVPGMPFNGDTIPSGKSLGGSESAGYYMAKALVARGHRVTVFSNSQEVGKWDGVDYDFLGRVDQNTPLGDRWEFFSKTPSDVSVIQRHPYAFRNAPNSKLNIWWLHDLALKRNEGQVQPHLINTDQILTVSEFQRQQVAEVYGITPDIITATTNGIDYAEYEGLSKPYTDREPNSMIFASRPERGLEELVKVGGIMEQLGNDYKLYVCCYDNTTEQMAPYYNMLWQRCEQLPNVEMIGHLGKKELAEKMASVMLYAYPTTFEDTSCMIALEANACGTPFMGFKTGALPETIGGAGSILLDLNKNGQLRPDKMIRDIKKYMDRDNWLGLRDKALAKKQPWEAAAEQWEGLFEDLLREKSGNTTRLYKHLESLSDIVAIEKDAEIHDDKELIPDHITDLYSFYFNGTFADHYKAYYEYEKDRGVDYGPEDLTRNNRFQMVSKLVNDIKPKTLLDYGCAHGHYVMNLAPQFIGVDYTGVDIAQSNVDKANKWKESAKLPAKIEFKCQDASEDIGKYDCILMGEVIEHVADPRAKVETVMKNLNPDGTMVITVPYGPWEAIGYEEHHPWRAHLHHLEKSDLDDMFSNQTDYRMYSLPSPGFNECGHIIVTFKPSGEEFGHIDYERKLAEQAPRETVSVCLIAHNESLDLAKCLYKIKPIADEIIIGIDRNTTDNTREIAEAMGAKCIDMPSPLDIGFDASRNLVISEASMDWVMWIDADELFERVENLVKYLRPNCFDGYAIKQVHVSAEPAGVQKIDYPVRLFRNNRGVQFCGIVHEHPTKMEDINGGVGKVIVLPDCEIMHSGYHTEKIRQARFNRNFPLMKKDRETYPERALGKFLWCRDMVHLIHFNMMKNGRQVTQHEVNCALEAVKMWRDLLKPEHLRYAVESLKWYSEASKIVSQGNGIEGKVYIDIVPGNGLKGSIIGKPFDPAQVSEGYFANKEDYEKLTQLLISVKTENMDYKYN